MFDSLRQKLRDVFRKVDIGQCSSDSTVENVTSGLVRDCDVVERVGNLSNIVKDGGFGRRVEESLLDDLLWNLEVALLEADVALSVVEKIIEDVRKSLVGKRLSRGNSLKDVVELSVKSAIRDVLRSKEFDFDVWLEQQDKPVSMMFIGINGTGKTTAIAKIANYVINKGYTVVMAAGDTFRAGAIEQITIHADNLGCKIIKHSHDADPAAVVFDAVKYSETKRKDALLIDTAGRMQSDKNLMDEMNKIARVAKPKLKIFVGDSLAGNDVIEQARVFSSAVGIDAVILTKMDADSKGGAALSIASAVGLPIAFISNGQGYGDIIKFSADWMIDRLFSDLSKLGCRDNVHSC